jgi:fructose-1,6-bisphosphatase/sedoheptulose 1,7-bisphosphatase-like protein
MAKPNYAFEKRQKEIAKKKKKEEKRLQKMGIDASKSTDVQPILGSDDKVEPTTES